jgi:hypothetical protein
MAKKFIWKVLLRLNLLTKDIDNDYIAEVDTVGKTLYNEDVAQAIKDEGSELQVETILDILNRGDRIRKMRIQQGYSIMTAIVHIVPRVLGNWFGSTALYDPKIHKLTCDMTPTVELYAALEEVGVEVNGVKDSGARIGLMTDVTTGKTDGTITPGGDLLVDGAKIKVAPEDDEGVGVFFVDDAGLETPVTQRLSHNDPKHLTVRIPTELAVGSYRLKIVTRYTGGSTSLKENRTIISEQTLTVKNPE